MIKADYKGTLVLRGDSFDALESLPPALLTGYGVYTSFAWPLEGQWLDAHLDRLAHDAGVMKISCDVERKKLRGILEKTCTPEFAWRLTLIPDVESVGALLAGQTFGKSLLLLSHRSKPDGDGDPHPITMKSVIAHRILAGIKSIGMAEMLHAKQQALDEGHDDFVWVNPDRTLSEASSSNIFFIRGETLYTPDSKVHRCLPGITRMQILESLPSLSLGMGESAVTLSTLHEFDGAFITNAVVRIRRITAIDGVVFPWPKSALRIVEDLQRTLLGKS